MQQLQILSMYVTYLEFAFIKFKFHLYMDSNHFLWLSL